MPRAVSSALVALGCVVKLRGPPQTSRRWAEPLWVFALVGCNSRGGVHGYSATKDTLRVGFVRARTRAQYAAPSNLSRVASRMTDRLPAHVSPEAFFAARPRGCRDRRSRRLRGAPEDQLPLMQLRLQLCRRLRSERSSSSSSCVIGSVAGTDCGNGTTCGTICVAAMGGHSPLSVRDALVLLTPARPAFSTASPSVYGRGLCDRFRA